ncbi:MAG: hypothetical protein PHU42_00165 [Patescibacteria group bacterium]|nr:hypothetical protein [Patescibacteria group bacterium]
MFQELAMKFGPLTVVADLIFLAAFIISGAILASHYLFEGLVSALAGEDEDDLCQCDIVKKHLPWVFRLSTLGFIILTLIMAYPQYFIYPFVPR